MGPHMGFGGKGGADIKGPKVNADLDVNAPGFDVSGDTKVNVEVDTPDIELKTPHANIETDLDVSTPDADIHIKGKGKPKGKFGFKMPKIGFGGKNDVSADADFKIEGPQIDVKGQGDISGDVRIKNKDKRDTPGKRLMALFQSPSRDSGADFDVSLKVKGEKKEGRSRSSSASSACSSVS